MIMEKMLINSLIRKNDIINDVISQIMIHKTAMPGFTIRTLCLRVSTFWKKLECDNQSVKTLLDIVELFVKREGTGVNKHLVLLLEEVKKSYESYKTEILNFHHFINTELEAPLLTTKSKVSEKDLRILASNAYKVTMAKI